SRRRRSCPTSAASFPTRRPSERSLPAATAVLPRTARPTWPSMSDADRPVLVTGGAGFIGSYVVKALLESGRRVVALDVHDSTPEGRFTLGALADEVTVEQGSVDDWSRIFHVVNEHRPVDVVHPATI